MRIILGSVAVIAVAFAGGAGAHEGHHAIHLPGPAAGKVGTEADPVKRRWLAGDHHVHSRYSVSWTPSADGKSPPVAVLAGDARYPIPTNAAMAARHGLSWMVATDHGGPNHSKIARDQAYPELLDARRKTPGLIQFYGMELDTPGADHSSLIVPHSPGERQVLFDIESQFSKRDAWPLDPARDSEARMVEALKHMRDIAAPPVVIANHPSRSAKGLGIYGLTSPAELRDWNDAAPQVAIGMEGSPGHQAGTLKADGSTDPEDVRGAYKNAATMGGFDQMTARLGGFWDSMLGEGRRWWITSTSDSHRHYTDGGNDFWPGEYAKTYVRAVKDYGDILDGLREGRVFVTTGDLISELEVTAQAADGHGPRADIGGRLKAARGSDVTIVIRVRDPAGVNFGGRRPEVARVDLIRSEIGGPAADRTSDRNARARIEKRFYPIDWVREGDRLSMTVTLRNVTERTYVRVRGTSGLELEPTPDPVGEDPWSDLWFYANPVFIDPS